MLIGSSVFLSRIQVADNSFHHLFFDWSILRLIIRCCYTNGITNTKWLTQVSIATTKPVNSLKCLQLKINFGDLLYLFWNCNDNIGFFFQSLKIYV